ncbi:initiator tRNA phosphoribosyl transferase [Colletotrichum phormii]|uniref:Initiator tRNA phosphoribosyl transferase n=1 Tax=Colletotrichum phormii TaxID=359342 RepID=A0AAJ0A5P6_9PEZI|nr:initiator tRNA phosphoribosyl transferase [Colletotrichum phormii]KAK1655541.1 initiator tRNA phosphoribosyl transferase [Colletotrichum phormii]
MAQIPAAAAAPALSDLIFPTTANHNFSHILTDLKRANLSIANRLRSITQDAEFVKDVSASFGRPLVANERCGSWYIRPADKRASAYFKSTDGHTNAWKFSTRRLNLHLLELVGRHDGTKLNEDPSCIIVDSTRRGKRMPDALSKTIPIWCAVLNAALFPDLALDPARQKHLRLFTPPNVVSASEHAQIAALLPSFLASLKSLDLDLAALRAHISKPLRPFWVTQETQLPSSTTSAGDDDNAENGNVVFEDYHPIICCTSSRRVAGTEMSEAGYIQGAGDDTENWALGLTAEIFWANAAALLSCPEADLPEMVVRLVAEEKRNAPRGVQPKQVAPRIYVCPLPLDDGQDNSGGDTDAASAGAGACRVVLTQDVTPRESWVKSPTYMQVGLGKHKVASRNLRQALPDICAFVSGYLDSSHRDVNGAESTDGDNDSSSSSSSSSGSVLAACETGKDLSIGAALAIYCWCFDRDGNFRVADSTTFFNKDMIRVKLGTIMTAFPEANANRATLQSVNSFLMDHRR